MDNENAWDAGRPHGAVTPAYNEAAAIGRAVAQGLSQPMAGRLVIVAGEFPDGAWSGAKLLLADRFAFIMRRS